MQDDLLNIEEMVKRNMSNNESGGINSVAIIGAGIMGQGIAHSVSAAGLDVLIIEKNEESLEKAKFSLSESIDREIKRWTMTNSEKKSILSRIKWSLNFEDVKDCDLIIEAVDENFELKKHIFTE